jgi:hypothetical protein
MITNNGYLVNQSSVDRDKWIQRFKMYLKAKPDQNVNKKNILRLVLFSSLLSSLFYDDFTCSIACLLYQINQFSDV